MAKKVLIPVAKGTEEIEAICMIDTLRRSGAEVTVASVETGLEVEASRGVKLTADCFITDCAQQTYDMILLPGGSLGAERLRDNGSLIDLLKKQKQDGRYYGAICAAPAVVLEHHGLLEGRRATAYPGFSDKLKNQEAVFDRVVVDQMCLTSRGPGTALEFAVRCVEALFGKDKADAIAGALLMKGF